MRRWFSPALVALVVAALFWGNCFTCAQVLFAAGSHGCCHKTKQAGKDCSNQVLQQFEKADTQTVPMLAEVPEPVLLLTVIAATWTPEYFPAEHAPPDLLSLHSSFRI